jgi:hypothetical protein
MKSPISVDIGIGAKAEIRTEIPSSSAGRFLDALTDVFRPFSEKRGLRADQIRLQREDVLIKIARKARERLAVEHLTPQPLPNKFLVPFLEAASLEDLRDEKLTDMWANLLAATSRTPHSKNSIFINILKELTSEEALLFEYIFTHYASRGRKVTSHWHFVDASYSLRPPHLFIFVRDQLLKGNPETWPLKIVKHFDGPGLHIRAITIAKGRQREYPLEDIADFYEPTRPVRAFSELSFDLLVRIALLSKVEIEELWVSEDYAIDLTAYVATEVGIEFFKAVASPSALDAAENKTKKKRVARGAD